MQWVRGWLTVAVVLGMGVCSLAFAEEPAAPVKTEPATEPTDSASEAAKTVEQLADSARKSIVVVSVTGRDGKPQGLGTGFIIAPDGLIATNLHVIGEARPISVQMADGARHNVTAVHASQRSADLALLRIDAKDLPTLELGDSAAVREGQPVVAIGNPFGLKHSVVSGVISGKREIEGRKMLQLAIPIEQGNSGGPVLDMQGRVRGIMTMKSLVTPNLGFAVEVNSLKPLIEHPNPVPMDRWLTIGALDPQEWVPLFGARWRQRAGRILVEGLGQGFGGRSLCISQQDVPKVPYEVAVRVKLDKESGAAGLVFASDGGDKHFGFYPTNGKVRLTRFDGADVFSWQVLIERATPHYRAGDWNHIKVRVEQRKVSCWVNDQLVIESEQNPLPIGKVGLAKFRDTEAEFKSFQVGSELKTASIEPELQAKLDQLVTSALEKEPKPEVLEQLRDETPASVQALRIRAIELEKQAERLREMAGEVHQARVRQELVKTLDVDEDKIDLMRAALLIAKLDNDEVDVESYERQFARMVRELEEKLPKDADDAAKLGAMNRFLFEENGFHGSRGDYYNKANSYLNEVLDDREGLPITLAVVYMELGRRLGLNIVGVALPGHFVVAHLPAKGDR
ncbi:MAG TPA: trypsin-like peptidase domain-containing protein, partial [Planctomycetaceae bacterium]|nr:trypsin-like peptidase domain-containing protein [Planctomycetaceae bacterium]